MNEDLIVVEAIVEDADAAANGGAGAAEDVPGETEPGGDLDAGGVLEVLVVDGHALEGSDAGGELTDGGGREFEAGDGITTDAGAGGVAEWLNESRLFGAVVTSQIEGGELVTSAPGGLDEIEAEASIDGEAAGDFPGVLNEPFDVQVASVAIGLIVGFRIALDAAEEGV